MEAAECSPYEASPEGRGPLRQGELLCNVIEIVPDSPFVDGEISVQVRTHPYAIVLSQDCDLDRDWEARMRGIQFDYGLLKNILLCEVYTAEQLRNEGKQEKSLMPLINANEWKLIRTNRDERFHFLECVPSMVDLQHRGVEELTVHFRRVFTIDAAYLYREFTGQVERRCRLQSPYLEHLSNRFAAYWSRVALPTPHRSL